MIFNFSNSFETPWILMLNSEMGVLGLLTVSILDHYNRNQADMDEVELEIGESDSEANPE